MKVCVLSFDFLPNIGGVATHVYELSRYLVKKGVEVDLITFNRFNGRYYYYFVMDGISVYSFRTPLFNKLPSKVSSSILLLPILVFLFRHAKKYDLFHFHGMLSLDFYLMSIIKRMFGSVRIVWTNHTSRYLDLYDAGDFHTLNKVLKIPDAVIAPSKELAEKTYKNTVFKKNRVFFIPNGVDINKFKPCSTERKNKLRKELGLSINDKVIISTRRFERKNGVVFLIKAFALVLKKLPNVKLVLIGDYKGPEWNSDKKQIFELIDAYKLNKNVIWLGSVPNKEISKYYCVADVSVIPSLKEAVSISGLESLAMGIPIIGSNIGGIPELVVDGVTGYLTKPADYIDLANNILRIFSDDFILREMSINARKRAVNLFSWEKIVEQTLDVYKSVMQWREKIC